MKKIFTFVLALAVVITAIYTDAVIIETKAVYEETPFHDHILIDYDAKAPTCTEVGWEEYEVCVDCGYTTYAEIPALGHEFPSPPPTFEPVNPGYGDNIWLPYDPDEEYYNTCIRCHYFIGVPIEPEIPVLGHSYDVNNICTECAYNRILDFITYDISNNEVTITGCDSAIDGNYVIPDTINGYPVRNIGDCAFECCNRLTGITILDGLTSIGYWAFYYSYSLANITIPDSVTSIQSGAFFNTEYYNKTSNWCDGVLYIGNHLIEANDSAYGEYAIKHGTKTIADGAFCWSNITSVIIPGSVTSISSSAFFECYTLTNICVESDNTNYCSVDGVLFDKNKTTLIKYPKAKNGTTYVVPYGVTNIADDAFDGCKNLTSIYLHNTVTNIGVSAFICCDNLTNVTIPDSVTSIGSNAFSDCTRLTSVTIGNGVVSVGYDTFGGCRNLVEIKVSENNNNYCSQDGVLFNKNMTELIKYPSGKTDISYSIPNGVINLSTGAFSYCVNIESLTFGNDLASIDSLAVYECNRLTSVTIPDNIISISDSVFIWYENLTIYGYEGSYAEIYANEKGIPFVVVQTKVGDSNGDGKINGKDYALLLQSINGWSVSINETAADVNGDGKLNGKDYVMLLQRINGWDVELK